MKRIAIVGIHTGIGKTVASAVIVQSLGADYWKPVQAGSLENSDTMVVKSLVSNPHSKMHDETYRLSAAMSPHAAAHIDGVTYGLNDFVFPTTENLLIVETAGGLMSPITSKHTVLDFVKHHDLPVILVSSAYLGSINHTLLCLEAIRAPEIKLLGLVFSGEPNVESENFIHEYVQLKNICHLPFLAKLNAGSIGDHALRILPQLTKWIA